MAELRIPIVSELKGKGFKDASKQTSALDKSVKKLGQTLAGVFGAQQLLKFAKNAVKAFIEDEKAAAQLARTVNNLGLAFETPAIERFISGLATASGVTDDKLRPSMQKLLQVTGSVTKSQELLTQALDVSRGSGVDFETVTNDLAQAYVGNLKGLRKYNLGLTQAELKSSSFADVQERLTKTFSGANAAFLDTYAGKIALLSNAAGEASETIGGGLVESLSLLAGEGDSITPLVEGMSSFATSISDATVGVGVLVSKLKNIPGLSFFGKGTEFLPNVKLIKDSFGFLAKLGKEQSAIATGQLGGLERRAESEANAKATAKAEAAAVKRAKELAALQKKTLATQKSALALGRASKTLDLERIGIEAALKNQISETDRLSLNLQLALLDKNETQATKLSAQLEAAVKRQNELSAALLATPKAPNPYADWKMPVMTMPNFTMPEGLVKDTLVSLGVSSIAAIPSLNTSGLSAGELDLIDAVSDFLKLFPNGPTGETPPINVTVVLDNGVVAGAVSEVQTNNNLSGSFTTVGGRGANTARFT